MAAMQISCVVLACDGCQTDLQDGHMFSTAMEARAAAYAAGWQFPPMVSKTGRPLATGSDVCPACLPGWKPKERHARSGYRSLDGTTRNKKG